MSLIVEDGTGLNDADSYETVEKAEAYAASFGRTEWASMNTTNREIRMRLASQAIDVLWTYPGAPLVLGQGLSFPRRGLSVGGVLIEGVPLPVRRACVELATYPGAPSLLPPMERDRVLSESKQIDGLRKSVTYADRPAYRHFWVAEKLLSSLRGETQGRGISYGRIVNAR